MFLWKTIARSTCQSLVWVCTYIHTYIHTYTYIIYVYIYTYIIYIYIYVYMCIYIFKSFPISRGLEVPYVSINVSSVQVQPFLLWSLPWILIKPLNFVTEFRCAIHVILSLSLSHIKLGILVRCWVSDFIYIYIYIYIFKSLPISRGLEDPHVSINVSSVQGQQKVNHFCFGRCLEFTLNHWTLWVNSDVRFMIFSLSLLLILVRSFGKVLS